MVPYGRQQGLGVTESPSGLQRWGGDGLGPLWATAGIGGDWVPRAYSGLWGNSVCSGRQQGLGVPGSPQASNGKSRPVPSSLQCWGEVPSGLQCGLGWLGSPRPTTGESRPPGPLGSTAGGSVPLGLNCSGALVTRAVGADDTGEPLEGTDDLASSPRLEILHEQQLKKPHDCPPCLSRLLVRQ